MEGYAFEDLAVRVPDISGIRSAIGFAPGVGLAETISAVAASRASVAGGAT